MTKSQKARIYRVQFAQQGKVYEVYARSVGPGELFGFVAIEGLLFGERSQVVVDPSEESLKAEFSGVERFHVPMHAVLRIDEVREQGAARIREGDGSTAAGGKVSPFPVYTRPPDRR